MLTLNFVVMLEEQFKAFLEAVKANSDLQEQLQAAADSDAVVTIAKTAGFVISADDLRRAAGSAQTKISDAELDMTSGDPWTCRATDTWLHPPTAPTFRCTRDRGCH
jgi:predicted ribosomally synthesized peptide with nif11-like leader